MTVTYQVVMVVVVTVLAMWGWLRMSRHVSTRGVDRWAILVAIGLMGAIAVLALVGVLS